MRAGFPSDTEFRYGGGQWQVSGAVAETAFGATWDDLINDIYVEPCGVSSLGYTSAGNFEGGIFSYPTWFDGDPANVDASLNPMIEGGVYINVADYGTLLSMHLNGGMCGDQQVLSQASLDLMHTDRIGEVYDGDAWDPSLGYGLGWWTQRASVDRHRGMQPANRSGGSTRLRGRPTVIGSGVG